MAEKKNSLGVIVGALVGTVAAAAGGFAFGYMAIKTANPVPEAETRAAPAKTPAVKPSMVKPLAPIITNLREPSNLFVRLEAVVVLEPDTPEPDVITAKISDNLTSYLRTVSLSDLSGPTGFQYVREDLRERSIQIGAGKVRELLFQAFVIQ